MILCFDVHILFLVYSWYEMAILVFLAPTGKWEALWTALSQRAVAVGGGRSGWAEKFTFFAITWIRLIGSRQNLAWTYYLTLGTSLRKNFSFFSKSKMAAGGQKICDALYLWFTDKKAPRTNRPLYVRLMGSRQNLAWTYYLTLGTTLRKNFSFFSKSKMAAAAITANYEIAHNLKSIQLRDPIFFPIPMFSRVRNAMKLSFAFYDLSNYLKFQNGRRNWRF